MPARVLGWWVACLLGWSVGWLMVSVMDGGGSRFLLIRYEAICGMAQKAGATITPVIARNGCAEDLQEARPVASPASRSVPVLE